MSTILDKDITRESTIKVDGREIQITLGESQKILMKLKGMKSGAVEIGIEELYKQLAGVSKGNKKSSTKGEDDDDRVMVKNDLSSYKGDAKYLISLHDIRHAANVRGFDMETTYKFDAFLNDLIKERKEKLK